MNLLPSNATQQERAMVEATARVSDIPVALGKVWNPDHCPEALLPWLAWSLSVDEWDSQWPEHMKRAVIKQSARIHRHKGTVGAVRKALSALGVTVDFLEWFESTDDVALLHIHDSTPHTFVFVAWANENPYTSHSIFLNEKLYSAIRNVVDKIKPVRSHYEFLVGAKFDAGIGIAASARVMNHVRIEAQTIPVQPAPLEMGLSAAFHLNSRRYVIAKLYA
ncbi:phage tail protein I [Algicola sagamiensis]|uniref:phage tail protein I n=1 Tax=Algicola sagamiensis TaxID=163869 RepID=UPI000373A706|nr:phage tail protein I [Algicola sagamiensis]